MPDEKLFNDPFGDFAGMTAWDAKIREAGRFEENKKPEWKLNLPKPQIQVIYDLKDVLKNEEWRAAMEEFKASPKKQRKKPVVSQWMREDVLDGVVYFSLRDVQCE